jgi:hypothetical protein
MRGRRRENPEGVFAGIRRWLFRAENDADACRSFAPVEWHDSDRLSEQIIPYPTAYDGTLYPVMSVASDIMGLVDTGWGTLTALL